LVSFNKQAHYLSLKKLEWSADPYTLATSYFKFKQQLQVLFLIDTFAQLIVDSDGLVLTDSVIPWYALKAAANFILSKVSDGVKLNLPDINLDDPISLLVRLDILCTNITDTTQRDLSTSINRQTMRNGESASHFIGRMHALYRKARIYHLSIPEGTKINILLNALRFAEEYKYLLAGWNQHRRDEQRYPNDFVNKKLTYQDIERTLHDHNNERQARTSIRTGAQQRNKTLQQTPRNVHQVNQVAAVVASKPKDPCYCFICQSPHHKASKCTDPRATLAHRKQVYEEFRKAKMANKASPSDATVKATNTNKTPPASKKPPKTIVQLVNLAVLEEPPPFFNNEPVQLYMVNHFIYDNDIANLTMSSFGLPESNIDELDSFDIDYDLLDEILEEDPIQDLQIEWAENVYHVQHQDDRKRVRDNSESSLFGSDNESDFSKQPRPVSIKQPIYDRSRKQRAKCSVAFNLEDPCCSDDREEKLHLPENKFVPPFQRLLNEDSSVSSEGLLN
jgi:hypothetical protein